MISTIIHRRRRRAVVCAIAMMLTVLPWRSSSQACRYVEDYRFGRFSSAVDIDVDPFGDIYISDAGAHAIRKYSIEGRELRAVGSPGWDLAQLDRPMGLDARLGITIYAADFGNNRIIRYDRELNPLAAYSTRDDPTASSRFGLPLDVAVTKHGALYVLDGENRTIAVTQGFASISQIIGGTDAGPGRLVHPVALALDERDYLYVLERDRVSVFDPFGAWRFSFGDGIIRDARGLTIHNDRGWVTTAEAIYPFTLDGRIDEPIFIPDLIAVFPPEDVQKIAFSAGRLLLLTAKTLIVFTCQQ